VPPGFILGMFLGNFPGTLEFPRKFWKRGNIRKDASIAFDFYTTVYQ